MAVLFARAISPARSRLQGFTGFGKWRAEQNTLVSLEMQGVTDLLGAPAIQVAQ
ncbi:hypothetical protein [Candidatus Amarobacter glycogenicus]|uniref:hypothetical protein n=1 Tax=Candidatus Amarobacter glycogenicus TaxID=3140699 RepID=UPI0031CCC940